MGCRPEAVTRVHRPPAEVYAALTDLSRYPGWMPSRFRAVEVQHLGPDSLPALAFEMILPGAAVPQVLVLAETLSARRVSLKSPAGAAFPMEMRWTLRPSAGGTRLRLQFLYEGDQPLLEGPVREALEQAAAETESRFSAALASVRPSEQQHSP